MANKHSLKLLFLATFTSIVLNAVPSFAATPGIWVGEAEFGTFDLVVNAQGTGIEKITYNVSDWTCGSFTFFSATISVTPPVPWPISDGAFSLTHTSESFLQEMTTSGTFESETQAAGDWIAVVNGTECTGTWEATIDGGVEPEPFIINAGLNDAWFDPATAGQGFLLTVFPDVKQMFVAWFTFDTERPPEDATAFLGEPGHRWLTAQGPYDGDTATLTIFVTEGGVFNAAQPAPTRDPAGDGTMTIEFADCTEGLVSYEIRSLGISGVIPIQRLAQDNIALCEILSAQ